MRDTWKFSRNDIAQQKIKSPHPRFGTPEKKEYRILTCLIDRDGGGGRWYRVQDKTGSVRVKEATPFEERFDRVPVTEANTFFADEIPHA